MSYVFLIQLHSQNKVSASSNQPIYLDVYAPYIYFLFQLYIDLGGSFLYNCY